MKKVLKRKTVIHRVSTAVCIISIMILSLFCYGCGSQDNDVNKKNTEILTDWTLNDSIASNPTGFDPIQIVDATTLNILSNCYEGLVIYDLQGNIVPGLAEKWNVSENRLEWTFYLKPNVKFHPLDDINGFKHSGIVSAVDVVYSLKRAVTSPISFNSWWLGDIVERQKDGDPAIWAVDKLTVKIMLKKPYALLNRLISVAGWIYPENIIEALGEDGLKGRVIGTGPYQLSSFMPDDKIKLSRWDRYRMNMTATAPKDIFISIISDPVASLEFFRAGNLDVVELDLTTLGAGKILAEKQKAQLKWVAVNHLEYLSFNIDKPPFDDVDLRAALNMSIDRNKLAGLFEEMVTPAFGFTPPTSPGFMGVDAIIEKGFHYNPEDAKLKFSQFAARQKNTSDKITIKLVYDGETMAEFAAQFVKDAVEKILPVSVELQKITWPELLQKSFAGELAFHRLWWLITSPAEDVYLQFYMPGKTPPAGLNMARYNNKDFSNNYMDVFGKASQDDRRKGMMKLEAQLIKDAVAIPLWHKKAVYIMQNGVNLPIGSTLRHFYAQSSKTGNSN